MSYVGTLSEQTTTTTITLTTVSTIIATISSPIFTDHSTLTPALSQNHGYIIPLIIVAWISMVIILTTAITLIVRRLRRVQRHDTQRGEAQSTIFSIDTPQTTSITDEATHSEQQSSSFHNVCRFLPWLMVKRLHTQRDLSQPFPFYSCSQGQPDNHLSHSKEIDKPVGSSSQQPTEQPVVSRRESHIIPEERPAEMEQRMSVLHEQMQRLSGQIGHLQRQLANIDGVQESELDLSDRSEPPAYVQS